MKKQSNAIHLHHWLLALVGLLLLLSLKAAAATADLPVQTEKDWQLQKATDATLQTSSCVASTAVAESAIPVKLELIFPEQDDKAAIILIRAKSLQGQIQKAYLRPDSKTLYTSSLLATDAASGEDVYLLSSLQIPEALQVIAAKSTLDVYFGEGQSAKLARFSLRGSSVTINRAAACRASKKLLNDNFLDLLRKDASLAAAVAGSTADFLASYQNTLSIVNQKAVAQQALTTEQQKATLIANQAASAQAASLSAAKREQSAIQKSAQLRSQISDIQASITAANQNLPSLQASRPNAAAAFTQAQNAVAAIENQIARLQINVDQAVQQQNYQQSVVDSVQLQINQVQYQIQSLQSQMSSFSDSQNQQRNRINQWQSQINDLSYRISSFNNHAEAQRILNNDSSYRQAQNDLARWQQVQQYAPAQITDAQNRLQKAREILQQCQSQPAPTQPAPTPAPQPSHPSQPQPPPGHHVPPPPHGNSPASVSMLADCSGPQNRLNMIEAEVRQRQNEYNQANNEVPRLQGQLANQQRDAEHRAAQLRNDMIAQRDDLSRQQQMALSQISQLQQQIDQIQCYNLPQQQQILNQRQSDLYQAQANLNAAANQVRTAQAQVEQYKIAAGYNQALARAQAAQNNLDQLDQEIADAQAWIANGPAQLMQTQQSLATNEASLPGLHDATVQAGQVLAQAQAAVNAQQAVVAQAQSLVDQMSGNVETSRRVTQGLAKTVF